VVLVESDQSRALERLDALRSVVPDGQTCSIGVARWSAPEDPVATLHRADAALYLAKETGRDRLVGPVRPPTHEDVVANRRPTAP
jgi:PleD family two-component response regulator